MEWASPDAFILQLTTLMCVGGVKSPLVMALAGGFMGVPEQSHAAPEEVVVRIVVQVATWLALMVLAGKAIEWAMKELARSLGEIATSAAEVVLAVRRAITKIRSVRIREDPQTIGKQRDG